MSAFRRRQSPELKPSSRRSRRSHKEWGFLIIWQFQVREGMEKLFERIYGPGGDWVRLFAQNDAYIRTELVHESNSASYLTLDFWESQEAYAAFRKQRRAEYKTLDLKCEGMTENEREIGRFLRVSTD